MGNNVRKATLTPALTNSSISEFTLRPFELFNNEILPAKHTVLAEHRSTCLKRKKAKGFAIVVRQLELFLFQKPKYFDYFYKFRVCAEMKRFHIN